MCEQESLLTAEETKSETDESDRMDSQTERQIDKWTNKKKDGFRWL